MHYSEINKVDKAIMIYSLNCCSWVVIVLQYVIFIDTFIGIIQCAIFINTLFSYIEVLVNFL